MKLNKKVNVYSVANTADSMGTWAESTTIRHTSLPCYISWVSATEKAKFGKETYELDARMYCRVVTILETDKVLYDSNYYHVISPVNIDELGHHMEVGLKRWATS